LQRAGLAYHLPGLVCVCFPLQSGEVVCFDRGFCDHDRVWENPRDCAGCWAAWMVYCLGCERFFGMVVVPLVSDDGPVDAQKGYRNAVNHCDVEKMAV